MDTDDFQTFTFIPHPLPAPTFDDIRRVCRDYRGVFGRNPNLLRPQRFTEKMHWCAFNRRYDGELPRPEQLEKFIELAEQIGAGLDHVRVDFYEWNGQPRVGE